MDHSTESYTGSLRSWNWDMGFDLCTCPTANWSILKQVSGKLIITILATDICSSNKFRHSLKVTVFNNFHKTSSHTDIQIVLQQF